LINTLTKLKTDLNFGNQNTAWFKSG